MKVVATIEARMNSTRLPGKMLLPVNGKPILLHLVNRIRQVSSIDEIVLATTSNTTDDDLAAFAETNNLKYFRGSEENVMSRVIEAADSAKAEVIVEIIGDCPLIDPGIVEQTIQMFLHNSCDYVYNRQVPSFPDGMDVQVYKLDTLKKSAAMTDDQLDYEHVTRHIRQHPEIFSHMHLVAPPELHWPDLELLLDEEDDYEFLKIIIEHFGDQNPYFSCREIVELLQCRPELLSINHGVKRRSS
jgi:spore coat polysaccharide biosynthesis protein SpsF